MVAYCGRGVGDDGEAERALLVFAMAEMKGGGCSGFQRLLSWCAGESFFASRVYIGMGSGGF